MDASAEADSLGLTDSGQTLQLDGYQKQQRDSVLVVPPVCTPSQRRRHQATGPVRTKGCGSVDTDSLRPLLTPPSAVVEATSATLDSPTSRFRPAQCIPLLAVPWHGNLGRTWTSRYLFGICAGLSWRHPDDS